MSKIFAFFFAISAVFGASSANAQMNCGQAVYQLQSYVQQVNGYANQMYYQGIPMQCGPNPQCRYMLASQLNGWYQQQTQLVNGWYVQIQAQCNRRQTRPPLDIDGGDNEMPSMRGKRRIDDLEVDDEDRTVRIRIPDTPRGFK